MPFSVDDPVEQPNSLYAATKRADELIGHTYAHLYGIPATGLRFFTVYGPWGRPDMAPILFTRAIIAGEPIKVFNRGEMWRDFTYIDDIVDGVVRALDRPAAGTPPHKLYNLGNHKSEKLTDFIATIEQALQRKAMIQLEPMQPGDVPATYADIEASRAIWALHPPRRSPSAFRNSWTGTRISTASKSQIPKLRYSRRPADSATIRSACASGRRFYRS